MYSYQIEKTFPVSKEDFDDSILTNEMFEFKAFKNQGYIVLEYDEFKNADIYINGIRLKTDDLKGKGTKKIDIVTSLEEISYQFLNSLEILKPFGMDFEKPTVLLENAMVLNKSYFGSDNQYLWFR